MIRKAVIPAAGYGTRFLPATKALPKEMLPIVDRPVIQYVVEEVVASGIQDILVVISRSKRAIEEHFDRHLELEDLLETQGRIDELDTIRRISSLAHIHFVWQETMNGLGGAILCARDHVGDEPFAVLLGDTLMQSRAPVTLQLNDIHSRKRGPVVALEEVSLAKVSRYGVIRGQALGDRLYQISGLIEKPSLELAPSNLAIAGRYVLVPEIFGMLDRQQPSRNGEIQLTDALSVLAQEQVLYGLRFEGRRYDLGNKLDWLEANVVFGLAREDIAAEFRSFLDDFLHPEVDG